MTDTNKQNPCLQKPCQQKSFARTDNSGTSADVNVEMQGRPVLYTGVIWVGILRRFLIPRTCGSPITSDSTGTTGTNCGTTENPVARSVSHVNLVDDDSNSTSPLFSTNGHSVGLFATKQHRDGEYGEEELLRKRPRKANDYSPLVDIVAQIQEASTDQAQRLSDIMQEGRAITSDSLNTMRSDHAVIYRWSAVTLSGLAGYLIGLRRGAVTRLVYMATGAASTASVCWPEQARHYNRQGLAGVRQCLVIGLQIVSEGPQNVLGKHFPKMAQFTNSDGIQDPSSSTQTFEKQTHAPNNTKFGCLVLGDDENQMTLNSTLHSDFGQKTDQENMPHSQEPFHKNPCKTKLSTQCQEETDTFPPTGVASNSSTPPAHSSKTPLYSEHLYGDTPNTHNQTSSGQSSRQEQNTKTSLHNYSLHSSLGPSNANTEQAIHENSDNTDEKYRLTATMPEPTLIIGDKMEHFGKEYLSRTDQHPLNKKLSRYYMKTSDEQFASTEKGYDDLYSKR